MKFFYSNISTENDGNPVRPATPGNPLNIDECRSYIKYGDKVKDVRPFLNSGDYPALNFVAQKQFDNKDWLGSVRSSFLDAKTDQICYSKGINYLVVTRSIQNYYPYGANIEQLTYNYTPAIGPNSPIYPALHGQFDEVTLAMTTQSGFDGMKRENANLKNIYTTAFREYDPVRGRWWSLDPKPTASESWYAGMGCNPVNKVDPDGQLAICMNNKNLPNSFNKYPWLTKKNTFDMVVPSNTFAPEHLEGTINLFVFTWKDKNNRQYAPLVAKFLAEHRIEFVLFKPSSGSSYGVSAQDLGSFILSEDVYRGTATGYGWLEHVVFHEIIHLMGHYEYDAWSACYAAGFITKKDFIEAIESYTKENVQTSDPNDKTQLTDVKNASKASAREFFKGLNKDEAWFDKYFEIQQNGGYYENKFYTYYTLKSNLTKKELKEFWESIYDSGKKIIQGEKK